MKKELEINQEKKIEKIKNRKQKEDNKIRNSYQSFNKNLSLARLGNGSAKVDLINMLEPLIISSIKKYCPLPKEYEDLHSDCVLVILWCLENFDGKRSFLKYVKSYLKYYLLDTFKYLKNEPQRDSVNDQGEDLLNYIEDDFNLEESLIKKTDEQILNEAINSLAKRQREIIILYYYKDMSLKNISQKLKISKWTVVAAKKQALDKLKKKLEDKLNDN